MGMEEFDEIVYPFLAEHFPDSVKKYRSYFSELEKLLWSPESCKITESFARKNLYKYPGKAGFLFASLWGRHSIRQGNFEELNALAFNSE